MARNIIDYGTIAKQAKKIREHGKQFNSEIEKIYSNLKNMHNCWHGERYNELLTKFNQIIPQLNTILELVVGKIPYTLERIANNYSLADKRENETAANNEVPNKIENLTVTNDKGMGFLTENVINMQREISKCFERAKEQMNQIEVECSKMIWISMAAEKHEQKFAELKSEIICFLENIKIEFEKLMSQAENDMRIVENLNNIGLNNKDSF